MSDSGVGKIDDWRSTLARLATRNMVWLVALGLLALLIAVVVDGVTRGCIDLLGYRSSGCHAGAPELVRGAVVGFWHDDSSAEPCPDGWQPFEEGMGRFLIGAGSPKDG